MFKRSPSAVEVGQALDKYIRLVSRSAKYITTHSYPPPPNRDGFYSSHTAPKMLTKNPELTPGSIAFPDMSLYVEHNAMVEYIAFWVSNNDLLISSKLNRCCDVFKGQDLLLTNVKIEFKSLPGLALIS